MSKILTAGTYAIVAKVDIDISDTPFTSDNLTILYEADSVYKHYTPGGSLNAFTSLVKGRGYIAAIKATVDLSDEFVAATDISSGGSVVAYNKTASALELHALNSSQVSLGSLGNIAVNGTLTVLKSAIDAITGAAFVGFRTQSGSVTAAIDSLIRTGAGQAFSGNTTEGVAIATTGNPVGVGSVDYLDYSDIILVLN